MGRALPLLALALASCGARSAEPPPTTPAEAAPAAPLRPCPLAEGTWVVEVPVPRGYALAVADGACLLIDERREASFASLASLAADAEGAELLDHDPDAFFRGSGLLGEAPVRLGAAALTILGATRPASRWDAELEGLGRRTVWTTAVRRGDHWLVVMLVDPQGARGELTALLPQIRLRRLENGPVGDDS